jgi:heme-degrading monooxygenase HmoA
MAYMYIRVWEYEIAADRIDAFLAAYGADGDWAQLFQRGRGYVGTELFRSTVDGAHFVTVDRWTDHAAWRAFLEAWRETYERLDTRMTRLAAAQHGLLEGSD